MRVRGRRDGVKARCGRETHRRGVHLGGHGDDRQGTDHGLPLRLLLMFRPQGYSKEQPIGWKRLLEVCGKFNKNYNKMSTYASNNYVQFTRILNWNILTTVLILISSLTPFLSKAGDTILYS